MSHECKLCKSKTGFHVKRELYDDRYGYPGKFDLLRCEACGHVFLDVNLDEKKIADMYSNYYPRSDFSVEQYKPHVEYDGFGAWLNGARYATFRWVPKNVRVLDIGCGFGESLGYHQSRGCEVYGVETDDNIRRVADKFGYNVFVGLFDPALYEPNSFDYVTMSQVIEHVEDPVSTLEAIASILKPGGCAILSTPNLNGWGVGVFRQYWINWHAPYHLHFFTEKTMRDIADKSGMKLEKVETVTPSQWLYDQLVHLVTCPPQGVKSAYWAYGNHGTSVQRVALSVFWLMHKVKITHLITRCFDALGVGDNKIYFLRKK